MYLVSLHLTPGEDTVDKTMRLKSSLDGGAAHLTTAHARQDVFKTGLGLWTHAC
jgi:hypothetical protein